MSLREMHHEFSAKKGENLDRKMAEMIAAALRQDYEQKYSSVKEIARHTDASLSTIRKWYEGQNPPNSKHLVMLARHSENVFRALLELAGKPEIWELYQQELSARNQSAYEPEKEPLNNFYTAKSCGINVVIDSAAAGQLNQRQLWFLGCLQQGSKVKSDDIMAAWQVSVRSAETDIAGLVKAELIRFVGARKTGCYEAVR